MPFKQKLETITLLMMCTADGSENVFDVVICIPSARGNFEQRNAIRETWLGHISQNDTLHSRLACWCYLTYLVGQFFLITPSRDCRQSFSLFVADF